MQDLQSTPAITVQSEPVSKMTLNESAAVPISNLLVNIGKLTAKLRSVLKDPNFDLLSYHEPDRIKMSICLFKSVLVSSSPNR